MKNAFDPKVGKWKISWPGRVARYDLVYLSPPEDPMQGIALGNGDVGVLSWCEGSRLYMAVNKCDLWDDAEFAQFKNWSPQQEECSTTLRHGCRVIIDFKMPVFDLFYLSDFEARLNLADASMVLCATGPFGNVEVKAFVDYDDGLLRCELKSDLKDNPGITVDMERFGSRTFAHWYSMIKRDATCGLGQTESIVDKTGMYITHALASGTFAVGMRIASKSDTKAHYSRLHSHAARAEISPAKGECVELTLGLTSPMSGDYLTTAKEKLSNASTDTRKHKKAWKQFWLRSFMESGDDYLDNLWHLAMYYANSCQGGEYPGRFINGLWAWNRDVQPWNFYFHWNQQELYWPLNAAGHHELIEPYLDYRFNGLKHAKKDAQELFDADGAFVSDVCDRRGCNSRSETLNHTPVAQIALDFWRQYEYTGDKQFLRSKALPYMIEASKYTESLFETGDDGKYHASCGAAYEGWIPLRDGITELSYGKALFEATIIACQEAGVEESRMEKWQDIAENLAPLPKMKMNHHMLDKKSAKLACGIFKGDQPCSDEILALGFTIKEKTLLGSMEFAKNSVPSDLDDLHEIIQKRQAGKNPVTVERGDWSCLSGVFPWAEFATVFPSGPIGLGDKGSPDFNAAVNTAKLYTPELTGWSPQPIVLARLGLGRELAEILTGYPDRWQIYINGWTHWGIRENAESSLRFDKNMVCDADLPDAVRNKEENKFAFPAWPFRHTSLEAMYVLACAMNESLLQSHDGIIRVAPATHKTQNGRFTLHAAGGVIVSAEIKKGRVQWISMQSVRSCKCRLRNPWRKAFVFKGHTKVAETGKTIVALDLKKGQVLMLVPDEKQMSIWKTEAENFSPNTTPLESKSGLAQLGIPRLF